MIYCIGLLVVNAGDAKLQLLVWIQAMEKHHSLEGIMNSMSVADDEESVYKLPLDGCAPIPFDQDPGVLPKFKNKRIPMPSHVDSSQISNLLNPTKGIRDMMQRRGITPRDHRKDNRAVIAELSARNHAMKQVASQPEPTPVKPPRLSLNQPPRASIKTGEIDFLSRNFKEAGIRKATPLEPDHNNHTIHKEKLGKIPAYLIRRKLELALDAERKLLEEEAKSLPPGFVLMPDEEKQEVLKTLEENKIELEKKLRGLPLVIQTPSLLRSKTEMDTQLREIEDAIKRFSRPKVYIALDDS